MKIMIEKMYKRDQMAIFSANLFLWIVVGYILKSVYAITPDVKLKIAVIIVCVTACTLATASLIAVSVHLKRSKEIVYIEDVQASNRK